MFSNGTWTQLLKPTKFSASPEQGILWILSVLFRTGKAAKSTRVSFLEGRKAEKRFPQTGKARIEPTSLKFETLNVLGYLNRLA